MKEAPQVVTMSMKTMSKLIVNESINCGWSYGFAYSILLKKHRKVNIT